MSTKLSNWLLGCGIGCGAILLLVIALIASGTFWVRDLVKDFDTAVEARETLDEQFGDVGDFVPWPGGTIPEDRVEAFLAIREATNPARDAITETFESFPGSEEEAEELESKPLKEKIGFLFSVTGSAFGLGPRFGEFFLARNQAMIEQEMGLGEYTYIYALIYYSWLEHPPGDGPMESRVQVNLDGDGIRHHRGGEMNSTILKRIRRDLLSMLHSQLAAIETGGDAKSDWGLALAEEIARLENNPGSLPWENGVPDVVAAALEPYRERLEKSYSPTTNFLELSRNKRNGNWSIQAE